MPRLGEPRTAANIFTGSIPDPFPDRRLRFSPPRRDRGRLQRTASQNFARSSRRPIKGSGSLREEVPVRWTLGGRAAMDHLALDATHASVVSIGCQERSPCGRPIQATRSRIIAYGAVGLDVPQQNAPRGDADPPALARRRCGTASVRPPARPHGPVVVHVCMPAPSVVLTSSPQLTSIFSPPRRSSRPAAAVAAAKKCAPTANVG